MHARRYVLDMIARGVPTHQISAGLSVSGLPGAIGCGEPRDGCGTLAGCNASGSVRRFDPHGSMSGAGWTRESLRDFLRFLDAHNVTSLDLWTGAAMTYRESAAICAWFIDELRAWRHRRGAYV